MRREQRQRVRELRQQRELLLNKLGYLDGQIAIKGVDAPFELVHERKQVEEELKKVEAEWDALREAPAADFNPYVGLRTFEEKDADLFFGRDALTAELVDKVRQWPFLAVMGPSGSGKSSVVRAGLLPELKGGALPGSEGWLYAIFKPGGRPLDALAVALAQLKGGDSAEAVLSMRRLLAEDERGLLLAADLLLGQAGNRRLVLVVDQAEELVTLAPADKDARATHEAGQSIPFVRQLLAAVAAVQTPVCLIITLRADFLHRVAEYPELARWIADHDVIVSAMTPEELGSAIYDPALEVGGEFEAGLAEELVEQVAGKPGALPLLEYTLSKLWEQRDGEGAMTWAAYKAMGGVEGALAARADAILHEKYGEDEREQLRHLLLKLIQPGEGALDSRRRALLDDLTPAGHTPDEVQALLKPLVDERLLTTGRDPATGGETAEVSHEALIRAWPTLREWIENGREDLRFQLQVEEAAREWEASKASEDFLWGGLRLDTAEAWLARAAPQLSGRENLFLAASRIAAEQREQQAAAARREREALLEAKAEEARRRAEAERKNNNRLRIFVGIGAALLVLALLMGLRWRSAKSLADVKTAEAVKAKEEAVAAKEDAVGQTKLAKDKAAEADKQRRRSTAGELAAQAKIAIDQYPEDPDLAILLARRAMTTTLEDGYIHPQASDALMQAMAKSWPWRLVAGSENGPLQSAELSPSGELLVTTDQNGTFHVWDLRPGQEIAMPVDTWDGQLGGISFSEDGALLASVGDESIKIWDTETWDVRYELEDAALVVSPGIFSPDNASLMVFDVNFGPTLWDLRSKQKLWTSDVNSYTGLFSQNSEWLLLDDFDEGGRYHLLDAGTGDEIPLEDGVNVSGEDVKIPGNLLIVTDGEALNRIVKAESGRALNPFGGGVGLEQLDISPDSSQIAVVSADGRALILRTDTGEVQQRLRGRNIDKVRFSKTGKYLLVRANDGVARLLLADNLQEVRSLGRIRGASQEIDRQFDAKDTRLLIVREDGTAWLHDLTSNENPKPFDSEGLVDFAILNRDGSLVLTHTSEDGAWIQDALSGRVLLNLRGITDVDALGFSPDSRLLQYRDKFWNTDTGDEFLLGRPSGDFDFSTDGRFVVGHVTSDSTIGPYFAWDTTISSSHLSLGNGGSYERAIFFNEGARILTRNSVGYTAVWDAKTGESLFPIGVVEILSQHTWNMSSPFIIVKGIDDVTRLWNISTGEATELDIDMLSDDSFSPIISPRGDFVIIVTDDSTGHVWDLAGTKELFSLNGATEEYKISPDGRLIGFITEEGKIRLVDSQDGTDIPLPAEIPTSSYYFYFSDDSSKIAVDDDEDRRLHVFDLSTGRRILGPLDSFFSNFSVDNNYLIVEDLSQDQRVKRLFDLRNGNELFAASPLGRVVAVSPDGAFVALHDAKLQKVVIAETKSEQQITSLDVTGAIGEVVFSLDNRLVAIKDETGVDVWDIRDHRHLWQLGGESLGVFSPDGQYILTSVHDDPRLRPTDPERLLTLSAPLIQRDPLALTPEELQRYGLD